VLLAGPVFEREAPRERLHVVRLRLRRRVRLAGVVPRLETGDVLGAGQRQQVAQLGGVHDVRCGELGPVAFGVFDDDSADPVTVHIGRHRSRPQQHPEPAGGGPRREHRVDHRGGHPRLVTQWTDRALPRVEMARGAGPVAERIPPAVVRPDAVAQLPVAGGAAEALDPRVLVRRHRLRGQLPAQPVGLLREQHRATPPQGGERRRHTAQTATDDEDVRAGHAFSSK
jgi:hypothetical protein